MIALLIFAVYMMGMGGCLQALVHDMEENKDALIEEVGFACMLSVIWPVVLLGYIGWRLSKRFFANGKEDEVKS